MKLLIFYISGHGGNLQPGTHIFPFQFRLPERIPSSFEGKRGHIRYRIEARAEVPWGDPVERQLEFKVDSRYDLIQAEEACVSSSDHFNGNCMHTVSYE